MAGLKQRLSLGIDCPPLFRADHVGPYLPLANARDIWKGHGVEQRHQSVECVGFALVGGGRQQQQVGGCLC